MEQYFASLSKRQTMLLLTSLAFGGSESVAALEHLSLEEEELLKHRAQSLLQIPREKRIPLVIQEIKRIVNTRRRNLANADAKRLAGLLLKERGAMVEVVLRALPSELADASRAALGMRGTVRIQKEVRPDILSIIRWKLEAGLRQGAPQVGAFRFTDLLMMPLREVISICDRMGARVLATAVAGLSEDDREAFFSKLPPDQKVLALKAAEAGKARRLNEADALTVLEMHGGVANPSSGMRSAGAQRLMRAAAAQSPEFAQQLADRHQGGELGRLMQRWFREERHKPVKGDGGRVDIVEQMERLAQKGVIDKPLRLPPPMRAPSPNPPAAQGQTSGQARRSALSLPRVDSSQSAKRDPIAERNARRAGASSSVRQPDSSPDTRAIPESSISGRIMRDGRPLSPDPMATSLPRRVTTSSAVQAPPKRKDRGPGGSGSSGRGPR